MSELKRLVLIFKPEGVEISTLYRKENGPNPGTKARAREVAALIRAGLQETLEALKGRMDIVGESGYEVREDVIVAETDSHKRRGQGERDRIRPVEAGGGETDGWTT